MTASDDLISLRPDIEIPARDFGVNSEMLVPAFAQHSEYVPDRDDPLHRVDAGDSHGGGLTAPMPGKVVALLAQPGQTVDKGTPLLILEAMKMEHTITAPTAGTIKAFCYAAGEQVSDGAALVEFAEQA